MIPATFVRRLLVLVLFGLFIWQTTLSFKKLLAGATTYTLRNLDEHEQSFPGVSICPLVETDKFINTSELTLGEEVDLAPLVFDVSFHLGKAIADKWFNESSLPEHWSLTVTFDIFSGRLIKCYTYTTNEKFKTGYLSLVSLAMRAPKINGVALFLHPTGDPLLTFSQFFPATYLFLPEMKGFGQFQQSVNEIQYQRVKRISTGERPCFEENVSFNDCLENFVERQGGCVFPWKAEERHLPEDEKICEDSSLLKDVLWNTTMLSEAQIFEHTGCLLPCTLMEYSFVEFSKSMKDSHFKQTQMTQVTLYLRSGGTPLREEVYMYDLLDFAGNVGGFLGLLLGASALSVFDDGNELVQSLMKKITKRGTKT